MVDPQFAMQVFEIEYRQIGETFRALTDYLVRTISGFFALNALLFAGLSFLTSRQQDQGTAAKLIALVGLAAAVACILLHLRYIAYTTKVLQRGAEIEQKSAGVLQLFTVILAENSRPKRLHLWRWQFGCASTIQAIVFLNRTDVDTQPPMEFRDQGDSDLRFGDPKSLELQRLRSLHPACNRPLWRTALAPTNPSQPRALGSLDQTDPPPVRPPNHQGSRTRPITLPAWTRCPSLKGQARGRVKERPQCMRL